MNEPTTGEIVRAIRLCEEGEINCTKCPFANKSCGDLNLLAADRLESQEREIERLKEELEQTEEAATVLHAANETHWTYIRELTARAEQAERERDAAVADMKYGRVCVTCKHDEKCRREVSETNQTQCIGRQRWTWRGLPQDGDGK